MALCGLPPAEPATSSALGLCYLDIEAWPTEGPQTWELVQAGAQGTS